MKVRVAAALVLLAAGAPGALFLWAGSAAPPETRISPAVVIHTPSGPVSFSVEVADTPEARQRGLMFRRSLPENAGMLFIFEAEAPRTFWMKNTLIPLDMLFIAADGTVVSVQEAVPCEADPCLLYPSEGLAKYVLEVNGGLAKALRLRPGQQTALPR